MNFDPKMMVQLLYQTHAQMTKTNPITYHEFPVPNMDFKDLVDPIEKLENLIKTAYGTYQQTEQGKLYGSVDVNPSFWTSIYISAMAQARIDQNTIGRVPNGCCNVDRCGIRKFYEVLHNTIMALA